MGHGLKIPLKWFFYAVLKYRNKTDQPFLAGKNPKEGLILFLKSYYPEGGQEFQGIKILNFLDLGVGK